MNTERKKKKYTDAQLHSAISAVKENEMSLSEASLKFSIPKATLHDKVHKKYPEGATPGAHTVLTKDEELQLVTWVLYLSDVGFPITKQSLLSTVKNLITNLERENPFKNGIPGRHWYEGFMARHPELSMRVSQNLTAPRANITEDSIRAWFGRVDTYLKKENFDNALTDPRRIFNCDESAFYLSPKENHVIVKKGSNRVYSRTANDEKECLTVLMTVSADGNMQPPLVIFPYKRTPATILLNMPEKWAVGRSDSGWMTGETFYEYVTNVFHPWLIKNNIQLPVILFMDGHSSHINLPLSEFCQQKQIILIALLPNSTHRLQPLDVAVFRPLKYHWKEYRQSNNENTKLKKEDFAKALDSCIKNAKLDRAIINGFRTCGLYPFDPNSIDYNKLIKHVQTTDNNIPSEVPTKVSKAVRTLLAEVEIRIPEKEIEEFRMSGDEWFGDLKNHGLFHLWKKINNECIESISEDEEILNANVKDLNTINLDCNTVWLENSEILNMEVQPNGSLVFNDQLPRFPESSSEMINITEKVTLDIQISDDVPPENIHIKENMAESPTPSKKVNLIPDKLVMNKPDRTETTEPHHTPSLQVTKSAHQSTSATKPNFEEPVNIDTQPTCLSSNNIINPGQPSTSSKDDSFVPETYLADKPYGTEFADLHHKTPIKAVEFESVTNKENCAPCIPTPLKNISTPFKKALFWPEVTKKDNNLKVKKRTIPTVATSEEFIAYQKKIDAEKREKEKTKEDKKNKRNNQSKDNQTKKRKITVSDNITASDDVAEPLTAETTARKVGDYVVVNYEGEFFPGLITEIKTNETFVKTMTMSGLNWKWPNKDDIVGYSDEEILCSIKCPKAINKRGVFAVPEIDRLRNNSNF